MRKVILTIWFVVLLAVGRVDAIINFNDGGYHLIDYVLNDEVEVDVGFPDARTQIEIGTGGWIRSLLTTGRSRAIISGGQISNGIGAEQNSELIMYSGTFGDIILHTRGTVEIYGGDTGLLYVTDDSHATINDGFIGSLEIFGNGSSSMSGGTILNGINIYENGLMTLIGTDFQVNGHNIGYGERASSWAIPQTDQWGYTWLTGTVSGLFDKGDFINNNFVFSIGGGDITFIPEPTTIILFGLGIFALRRKR